jgi:CRISPR-associated protein Csb2
VFAISIELLAERYTATQFNDRSRAEWPPHPARPFSAMVAAWADNDEPDPAERDALRWLEEQAPAAMHVSEGRERVVVTHYVPVNDTTALARNVSGSYRAVATARERVEAARLSGTARDVEKAQAALVKAEAKAVADTAKAGQLTGTESASVADGVLGILPENRGKQGRTYPSVVPDDPRVWFIWREAEPSGEQFQILDDLLSRVGRIGHSSTLVSCRALREAPAPTLIPVSRGNGTKLRIPRSGSVSALEDAYSIHQGEQPRTLPAGMAIYREPGSERGEIRSPLLGGDWHVLGIRDRRFPSAVQALSLTRAVRGALLSHGDQPPSPFLSGHKEPAHAGEDTAPLERPHLAVVPLINAGNPYSDGAVFGVALVLPRDCDEDERAALHRSMRSWGRADFPLLDQKLEDLGPDRSVPRDGWMDNSLSSRRKTMTRSYWCRPSRRWVTVTPIALDRFPGNLRSSEPSIRDRAEDEACASIRRACVFAGLVDNPEEVDVTIRLDAPLVGIPASPSGPRSAGRRLYPGFQTGKGAPRACVHAEIEFKAVVSGPVLIGAGRYLGYGLCLPRPEGRERA